MKDYPSIDNIVRADTHLAGWRIKKNGENSCKVTFVAHTDFKVALFL